MNPLALFLLLLLATSQGAILSSFSALNFTLLGDSSIENGVVSLTAPSAASSGSVLFSRPLSLANSSFSTSFSFSLLNSDGLAFFLSPHNRTLGSPGAFLGLVNSSRPNEPPFFAVEFDTRMDPLFRDPDDCHVGVDVDSLVSLATASPISHAVQMNSGRWTSCWIDYAFELKKLIVFLTHSPSKPTWPILLADVDLSSHLQTPLYAGFSGSSAGVTLVANWTFHTSLFVPERHTPPHSVFSLKTTAVKSHRSHVALGLAIAGPSLFVTLLAVLAYRTRAPKRPSKPEITAGPREFTYKELSSATRGFHSSRVIGRGAYGDVYKAFFESSGVIAAVKRSKHTEGKAEFLSEFSIISSLRHKNLVQLLGWCTENNELLLVYEFMPYGSLDKMLHQNPTPLAWKHRKNIIKGLASALAYLHQECEQRVIHRDIKTSNILLDGNFNSRLGDFGLAKVVDHDKSPLSTLTAGTMGYLAPEYLQCGKANEKTDVYSFGVVVLEVASGRRPIVDRESGGERAVSLVDWVWGMYGEGRVVEAGDGRLRGEFGEKEMEKMLVLGLSCVSPDSLERPTIRRVLQILNDEAEALRVPKIKPSISFSSGLTLSVDDIVSDCE